MFQKTGMDFVNPVNLVNLKHLNMLIKMSSFLLTPILNELIKLDKQQKITNEEKLQLTKLYISILSKNTRLKETLINKINRPMSKEMDYYMLGYYLADLLSLH